MSAEQPEPKPVKVNATVLAGYVIWATLLGWVMSPASPSWPTTLVLFPLALVASFLIGQKR